MNLIYSCVFYNKEYIKIIYLLLLSFIKNVKNKNNYMYLIITCSNFESDIQTICKQLQINYDIWILDKTNELNVREPITHVDHCFKACFSRFYICNYPKIKNFEKILYLDCDSLIANDISPLFDFKLNDLLYVLFEKADRNSHGAIFSDEEFKQLDKSKIFTTAIMLFNNNDFMLNKIKINLINITDFYNNKEKHYFDQPFINHFFITNKLSDNQVLSKYCLNIDRNDNIEKVNLINNYTICHFSTKVNDHVEKLNRIKYSFQKL